MVWISEKQKLTMGQINSLCVLFGKDRWFTQGELHKVTLHTLNALVDKGYLEEKEIVPDGCMYYRLIKKLDE